MLSHPLFFLGAIPLQSQNIPGNLEMICWALSPPFCEQNLCSLPINLRFPMVQSRSFWITLSQAQEGDFWDCPVLGQDLGSMIHVGPFQNRIFYDSTIFYAPIA